MLAEKNRRTEKERNKYLNNNNTKNMGKKISAVFAVIVILIIGGFVTFLFIQGMNQAVPPDNSKSTPVKIKKIEPRFCTQEAKQCPDGSYVSRTGTNCEFAPCPGGDAQMANPASVYCVKNGGKSEIRTEGDGGQTGFCKFSNGKECEEWKYFKGECSNGEMIYKNNEFNFSVTLPKEWEKYQVSIQKDKGDDKHTYIYFMMPTAEKSWTGSYDKNTGGVIPGMADIFVITANDLSTWNKDLNSKECKENPNPSCPYEGSVLAKNSKYVFDASYGNGLLPPDVQKFRAGDSAIKFLAGRFKLLD
jgi:putative hemolysin